MDNQIKNIFKYALVLFIITALTASLLAWVNMVTADKIAQNAVLAENNALCEVMVNAESFEMLDEEIANGYGAQAVYVAKDATEKPIGLCVKMANNGYGGEIVSIIGVDLDAVVTGVSVISHSETPGLGAKLVNDDFKGQFTGKGEVSVVKAGAKNDQVNAISGATRSSKALASSVNSAVSILKQIKGEGIYIQ